MSYLAGRDIALRVPRAAFQEVRHLQLFAFCIAEAAPTDEGGQSKGGKTP